jgi:hypothetical protein
MFFFAKRRRSEEPEPLAACSIGTSDHSRHSCRLFFIGLPKCEKELLRWIIDFGRRASVHHPG